MLLQAAIVVACEGLPDDIPSNNNNKPEENKGKYEYQMHGLAQLEITTENGAPITSKEEYVRCTVKIDGGDVFPDYEGTGRIRGRGNSTWYWDWFEKKPYRIKLDESSEILGIEKNKDWVLLANFRDPTHMMNMVGFTIARFLGLPYTNHPRYAEVTINGEYLGLYMVTEQVEEGGNRVNIDEDTGYLVGLDVNDGPGDCPDATDNFWSEVYWMASCVKYPKDPTPDQVDMVKDDLAELEEAIMDQDYELVSQLLDVESMIHYILVQEIVQNVEMDNGNSTRSVYIHYDDGVWTMGPVWDFDGAFDFRWTYTHNYFDDYRELIFGSDPYNRRGAYGAGVPGFYSDLFGMAEFVTAFKARWNETKDDLLIEVLDQIDLHSVALEDAMDRDLDLWGISPDYTTEIDRLCTWIVNRMDYLDRIINAYPAGAGAVEDEVDFDGTEKPHDCSFEFDLSFPADQNHHSGKDIILNAEQRKTLAKAFVIQPQELAKKMSSRSISFYAVEPSGNYNSVCTASGYGHWFDAEGYVTGYGDGCFIFSEFNEQELVFSLGQFPGACKSGDEYVVSQALVYKSGGKDYTATFTFNVTIE